VGIGIQKTNAGIGIPASVISVRYRTKKMPDCAALFRYRIAFVIVSFFQSGTGLTGCRTIRYSGTAVLRNFHNFSQKAEKCARKYELKIRFNPPLQPVSDIFKSRLMFYNILVSISEPELSEPVSHGYGHIKMMRLCSFLTFKHANLI
jgi:hypothetical protein